MFSASSAVPVLLSPISIKSHAGTCDLKLPPFLEEALESRQLDPRRYRAVSDWELCNGCQTCIDRCHFNAIEMTKSPDSKKLKASVDKDVCMGCSLCVLTCEQDALTMELVRPPEHIPTGGLTEARKKRMAVPNWLSA